MATVTALTAASIAGAYRRFVFRRLSAAMIARTDVVLAGGGAKNAVLRAMIAERIAPARSCRIEDFGMTSESKEALVFAVLAFETLRGRPGNIPSVTGAKRPVILGKMIAGR